MPTSELIAAIDEEISRLMQVRKLLLTGASIQTSGRKHKRHLSAEGRARISAAMKKHGQPRSERVGDEGVFVALGSHGANEG